MPEIALSRDKVAQVDIEDLPTLSPHRWYALKGRHTYYAVTQIDGKIAYMHRMILQTPKGCHIDHINSDGLDNRKANLRFATASQNQRNGRKKAGASGTAKTSKYKGVSLHHTYRTLKDGTRKQYATWRAEIELPGRVRRIKYAKTEKAAAAAYNMLAVRYFGQFAKLNALDD